MKIRLSLRRDVGEGFVIRRRSETLNVPLDVDDHDGGDVY